MKQFRSKTDNHPRAVNAKIEIRRNVLEAVGREAIVFDAFAGSGKLYEAVWKEAGGYVGCDTNIDLADPRMLFCADNRRVLRAIDLKKFSIFDLDAYGSPWVQAIIIAARRKVSAGERIGMVLTEGVGVLYNHNGIPGAVTLLTGLRNGHIVGLAHDKDRVVDYAIAGLAKRMNCSIEKRWQAEGRTGTAMRYIGLVFRGL